MLSLLSDPAAIRVAMSKVRPPVGLIAGPTASGKSALALTWAERVNGVIINADSAQLYAGLRVLSAGPSPTELARAEHRLFGFRDPAEPCSAAEWAALAANEVTAAHRTGPLPILVGGTGLYLRTLLDGIAPIPPIDPAVRSSVRSTDIASNHAMLMQADPESAARLRPTDTTRIARALEVVLSTGQPLSHWQKQRSGGIGGGVTLQPLLLLPPRPWLYQRCDQRFAGMIDDGAAEEVQALLARNLDPSLPAMRAISPAARRRGAGPRRGGGGQARLPPHRRRPGLRRGAPGRRAGAVGDDGARPAE